MAGTTDKIRKELEKLYILRYSLEHKLETLELEIKNIKVAHKMDLQLYYCICNILFLESELIKLLNEENVIIP